MEERSDVMENKAYRRDRAGLVLISLIVVIYIFAGGYISEDAGSVGNLSLIIGVKFKNPQFIEILAAISLFYFVIKFYISSSEVRKYIHDTINEDLAGYIILSPQEQLADSKFEWYRNVLSVGGFDEGTFVEFYKIHIYPFSKHYKLSKKVEIRNALILPEYLDYYVPWLFFLIATGSIIWLFLP